MLYAVLLYAALHIPIILRGIYLCVADHAKKRSDVVSFGPFIFYLGVGGWVLFLGMAIWASVEGAWWAALLLVALSGLGTMLLCLYVHRRIVFDKAGFTASGFFGIKRRYTYGQITAARVEGQGTYLYLGRARIAIDYMQLNGYDFLAEVGRQYQRQHGASIPILPSSKQDVYKGNVSSGTVTFVAGCIMQGVLIGFLAGMILVSACPDVFYGTSVREIVVTDHAHEEDKLYLTTADGTVYSVPYLPLDHPACRELERICDGQTVLTVTAEMPDKVKEDTPCRVTSVSHAGGDVWTHADFRRASLGQNWPLIGLGVFFNAVWGTYMVLAIIAGRNPAKHPTLFRMCFPHGRA